MKQINKRRNSESRENSSIWQRGDCLRTKVTKIRLNMQIMLTKCNNKYHQSKDKFIIMELANICRLLMKILGPNM